MKGGHNSVRCPHPGCFFTTQSTEQLKRHARAHLSAMKCLSCGREFETTSEWSLHCKDDIGCHRKRLFESEEEEERRKGEGRSLADANREGLVGVANADDNGDKGPDASIVGAREDTEIPALHIVPDGGFNEEQLALEELRLQQAIHDRLIPFKELEKEWNAWWNGQSAYKTNSPNSQSPFMKTLLEKVVRPQQGGYTGHARRQLFDFVGEVSQQLPSDYAGDIPMSFTSFEEFCVSTATMLF